MKYLAGILDNGKSVCIADRQTDCVMFSGTTYACDFYNDKTGECECHDTKHRRTK